MSMRVDHHATFPGVTLQPRTPTTWIPDERVQRCFSCNVQFSLLRRKHHCRSCGRIFCASCTSYREKIPSYFQTYAPSPCQIPETQRMCAQCASNCRRAECVEWLVKSLAVMPVTFPELFQLRLLDKNWNDAVNTLLSLFRGLQYKLPCQEYTKIECYFLATHFSEFQHHVPWQVHTLCALKSWKMLKHFRLGIDTDVHRSCRWLLCSRTCHGVLSIDNIIRLGVAKCFDNSAVLQSVIAAWKLLDVVVHKKMMCWWVYLACKHIDLFKYGLIPLCGGKMELLYALWFECDIQKNTKTIRLLLAVQKKLIDYMSDTVRKDLENSAKLVEILKEMVRIGVPSSRTNHIRDFFSIVQNVRLPWAPETIICDITPIKRYSSSSKPLLVTFRLKNNQSMNVLIKQEDVRTDRLAMMIGYWISSFAERVHVHYYDVFPLSKNSGCVVMIPEATTLYDIRKKTSLLNFIMTQNPSQTSAEIRERMVSSCAGACLLAFTMGLGDRHLENILVTSSGHLAHVDFGYVLGDDPKHVSTPMRITEDMVDAMGGRNSPTFVSFIQRTQKGYESMRLHAPFWYHLLSSECFIFENPYRPWKRIRDHVLDRFVPGEWDEEASLHIQTIVQRASSDSIFQLASDFVHLASNSVTDFFHMEL